MKRLLCGITWFVACAPLWAEPQLVMAGRGLAADRQDHVVVWRSTDGVTWSDPTSVIIDSAPARTASRPNVFFRDGLFHLLWLDPQGRVRYAISRTGLGWTSLNPLATLSPASGATFVDGDGTVLALLTNGGRAVVVDLDSAQSTAVRSSIRSASFAFGRGKFVMALVQQDWRVAVLESADGRRWSALPPLAIVSTSSDQSRSATLSFAEDRFLLAVASRATPAVGPPVVRCEYFEATEGAFGAPRRAPAPCSNSDAALWATRLHGRTLLYRNQPPSVSVSVDFAPWTDAAGVLVNGPPSLAAGVLTRP